MDFGKRAKELVDNLKEHDTYKTMTVVITKAIVYALLSIAYGGR